MEEYKFLTVNISEMSDDELDDIVGGAGAIPGVCCRGMRMSGSRSRALAPACA
jgi:hypothetical protein